MPLLKPNNINSYLLYSKSWALSEVVQQLRRFLKLQRLGIYVGSVLLVSKTHHWFGLYAIGFFVFVPIGLAYTGRRVLADLKKLVANAREINRLINAQVHVTQQWQEFKILHRKITLTDTSLNMKFDQYIEDQTKQCWHISSNGKTLNINLLDSSLIHILKKKWK